MTETPDPSNSRHDRAHQLEDAPAETVRLAALLDAESPAEHLFQRVLRDQRQAELCAQPGREPGLARAGRTADDDERR
jgi:hypothetical protein